MPLRDEQRIRVKADVLSRVLDGEAVLLDLASGTYFGLDPIGSEIWELIQKGVTVGEIRAAVTDRYEVDDATAAKDLEDLVNDLVTRGLADVE